MPAPEPDRAVGASHEQVDRLPKTLVWPCWMRALLARPAFGKPLLRLLIGSKLSSRHQKFFAPERVSVSAFGDSAPLVRAGRRSLQDGDRVDQDRSEKWSVFEAANNDPGGLVRPCRAGRSWTIRRTMLSALSSRRPFFHKSLIIGYNFPQSSHCWFLIFPQTPFGCSCFSLAPPPPPPQPPSASAVQYAS